MYFLQEFSSFGLRYAFQQWLHYSLLVQFFVNEGVVSCSSILLVITSSSMLALPVIESMIAFL